jgi:hypothetical protein
MGMSGCGSGIGNGGGIGETGLVTPAGSYTLNLTFTGSNGLTTTHLVPVSLTIIPYGPPQ